MILKVNPNLDELMFGIRNMRVYENDKKYDADEYSEDYISSSIVHFSATDVRIAYSIHHTPYEEPEGVMIKLTDGTFIEVEIDGGKSGNDKMKNIEHLLEYIMKIKMLGTKWEEKHPEKYI